MIFLTKMAEAGVLAMRMAMPMNVAHLHVVHTRHERIILASHIQLSRPGHELMVAHQTYAAAHMQRPSEDSTTLKLCCNSELVLTKDAGQLLL